MLLVLDSRAPINAGLRQLQIGHACSMASRQRAVRNVQAGSPRALMQPRYAMSILRAPVTRTEIRAVRGIRDPAAPIAKAPVPIATEGGKSSGRHLNV